MVPDQNIFTIPMLRAALKVAKHVYILPRFGTSEFWIRVTKAEVQEMLRHYKSDQTPEYCEMYTGNFGTLRNGDSLYLG